MPRLLAVKAARAALAGLPAEEGPSGERFFAGEALGAAKVDDRVFIDDGKLAAKIERGEPWGLAARVTRTPQKGVELKPVNDDVGQGAHGLVRRRPGASRPRS